MITRFSFSNLAISLLLVFASANLDEEHSSVEFSYTGLKGPGHWGLLNKSFSACATGKHQSPVNILTNQTHMDTTLGPLAQNYIPSANATIVNLGFVIGVHYEEEIGDLVIKGKKYSFKQMHWHTPAEHQIDGQRFASELHAVHLADDGSAAVISILYNYGKQDPLIKKISKYLYELRGSSSRKGVTIPMGKLDTNHLRRKTNKYYRYMGSLTTPPCTEDVTWTVLSKVRSISKEQVEALRAPLASHSKRNARPSQPLNGRTVELYEVEKGHHLYQV